MKNLSLMVNVNGLFPLVEATFCGGGGDSGGPVVNRTNNALGVYVGVNAANSPGTCSPVFGGGTPNSVFQSLGPYLARYPNVTIMSE